MEITGILKQIDSLKKEAEALQPVKPEFEAVFWNKFRLDFDYNSNHLEGNTLTYGHTQLLLLFDKVGGDYSLRELEEMKAHDVAMRLVKEAALDPEHILTEKFIKEINELILVRPFYKEAITPDGQPTRRLIEPGKYKKYPNSVRLENGEIFNYASPEETPAQMGDLMSWYRKEIESKELHPVQLAGLFHYRFVRIHPFDDSNGRTSRLLMNYILIRNEFAPAVIESVDKKNYLTALNRADTGDIEAFVLYTANVILKWQELYTKAIKGEKIEQPDDFEKEVEILKRTFEKQKFTKKISEEVALTLFANSLIKLFEAVISKLTALNSFAFSNEIKFGLDKNYLPVVSSDVSGSMTTLFLNEKDRIINGGAIDLQYVLKGVATKRTGVNIYSEISVHLKEYTYYIEIEHNGKPILEKRYEEELSATEIDTIALQVGKRALERIKDSR